MSALRHRHKMVVDTRLGTPSFRGERPRKFSVWGVVNHTEISNYPYCLSSLSKARCACRATHTSPLLNLPRLNRSRRLAATGLPSRPQRHEPRPVWPCCFPSLVLLNRWKSGVRCLLRRARREGRHRLQLRGHRDDELERSRCAAVAAWIKAAIAPAQLLSALI